MRPLPRSAIPTAAWIVPAFAAAIWSTIMALAADEPEATQRSLVFLGGPLLLLAGLHARLAGFLHDPERSRTLPLPIVARRHWQAGAGLHLPSFGATAAAGCVALLLALPAHPTPRGVPWALGLTVEFMWLCAFAALLEPCASAASAALGRRFPDSSPAHEIQRSLGGGWTTPEAVIHLYAPAFAIGLAALLAMPGQLGWARWLDGMELSPGQLAAAILPLALAIGARVGGPAVHARGMWEAIPWLSEATRTLAGPPTPEAAPAMVRRLRDPWLRLLVLQFLRATPLPWLRLLIVIGASVAVLVRASPPDGPGLALAMSAIGLWLVPAQRIVRERGDRAQLAAALPLGEDRRAGRWGVRGLLVLMLPASAPLLALGVRLVSGL